MGKVLKKRLQKLKASGAGGKLQGTKVCNIVKYIKIVTSSGIMFSLYS